MKGKVLTGPVRCIDHELYRRWSFMRCVCLNPNHPDYRSYGAKGIKIDPDFDEFWNFVDIIENRLGPPPNGRLSKLARIDQNGDYTIKNLIWDEAKGVGRRCAKTYRLKYKNKTLPLKEWSEITGINFHTLLGRLERGWKPAEALGYREYKPRSK